jgi:hypothetical protein
MKFAKLKKPFLVGIVIILILAVIAYALAQVGAVVKPLISPVAHRLEWKNVLGMFTVNIFVILSF